MLILGCLVLPKLSSSQQAITYSPVISGLSAPVEAVNAGDGTARLFVVQQNGIIRVWDPVNGLLATPFLNISSLVRNSGEQGLLSMAFHPQYETNGYFFVYYNNTSGAITVARYQATGTANTANPASGVVLLTITKPFDNHNGGHLQFGQDGNLYFATGDGGSGNDPFNNAQDSTTLLGKMLRINVDNFSTPPYYTVPVTNPFYTTPNFDNRIWARGLRNPFRWSFDRLTGDMWIGDVGQGAKEEINFTPAASTGGENYGWRCYEGSIRTPGINPPCDVINYKPPVYDYDNPSSGASSVVGGYVYRGAEYPFFQGYYVAVDVYSGNAYLLRANGTGGFTTRVVTGLPNFVVGFGEGEDGTLYAVQQSTGTVYKIIPNVAVLPISLQTFTGRSTGTGNELRWTVISPQNMLKFVIEYSTDGIRFTPVGELAAATTAYSFLHRAANSGAAFYRLQVMERNGSVSYSSTVKINGKGGGYQLYPTVIRDGRFTIITEGALQKIQVLNSNGAVVFEQNTNAVSGQLAVQLPALSRGIYFVRLLGNQTESKTVMVE